KMLAYEFSGYWKDVGTISSLYEANMDLLGERPKFDIFDTSWKIQSRSPLAPPHYVGDGAKTSNSIIMSGSEIFGDVENSVLASDVVVKKGAKVRNSILMSGVTVGENSVVDYAIVDENAVIGKNCFIGEENSAENISVLGRGINVCDGAKIGGGQIVDKDVRGENK
ncbi:MAG: glucose-1-phosphate adenylyltransferase, partial [Clostridia bacterium]|nr:glucose-1-phosphate adenylyltransferase [Clostridia bacterium]